MREEIQKDNLYINIDLFIKEFHINKDELYTKIYNNDNWIIVMNSIIYNNIIYINIKGFMYLIYNYITYTDNIKETINYFINNINDLSIINKRLIKQIITIDKLQLLTNSVLLFDNQSISGYLYIIKYNNHIKIGITSNPIKRIRTLQYIDDSYLKTYNNAKLISLFRFNNINIAKKIETNIKTKYNNYKLKGEWFNFNEDIINNIKLEYNDNYIF